MNDIVFRRINGRIIPIRIKKKEAIGATSVVAGAAVAAVGGAVAHNYISASAKLENVARSKIASQVGGQMNLFRSASVRKILEKSKVLHGRRNFAIAAGALAAAPLIAYGVNKFLKKGEEKKSVAAGFTVASSIASLEYYRRLLDPRLSNVVPTLKKAAELAKNRKTIQFILRGI